MKSAHPSPHFLSPKRASDESRLDNHAHRIGRIEALIPTLATKADMNELRLEMLACFERYYAEMHKLDARTTRWMIATVIGLFLGFAGLFIAMRSSSTPTTAMSPQPAIIYLPSSARGTDLTPPDSAQATSAHESR